jgi:CRP-like cAMP-binding protein/Fe-S-cluster-containing hydrogenase component 2
LTADVLKRVSLFEGVDASAITGLFEAGRIARFRAGDYVVRQGEYGDSFFVMLRGEALVESTGVDGRTAVVMRLKMGDYFGELALLGRGERKASVLAKSDAEVLELRKVHFDKHLKSHKHVTKRLEEIYTKNALQSFLDQSRGFRTLHDESKRMLVKTSSLASFSKGDVIAAEGQPAHTFYIVRSGFVRISRAVGQSDEIVAYLGPEDFFGDEEAIKSAPYATTAVAVEPVECITVPRSSVWSVYLKQPELFAEFRRFSLSRSEAQVGLLGSKTAMGFVRDMLEAGLGQARSALIINLEACVRCGNCVQACDDLHGFSRIARRGKKLTHRTSMHEKAHESLYFPTSCLQCATPECMVGCPTGAIARDVGGEVYIKDTCIGCGSCARNCDFGNITMAHADERHGSIFELAKSKAEEKKSDLVAVKCDVCFEREFAACVYNCPTEAILRIDPSVYFDELKAIAPKRVTEHGSAKTTTRKRRSRGIDGALQAAALGASTIGGFALYRATKPVSAEGLGLYAGVGGAALMLVLALIGARKRLRTHRFGSLAAWARVHAVIGGVMVGVALFHAGYEASSVLTSILLAMTLLAILVGIGGQIGSAIIPRLLAASEDEALLPEDVGPKIKELQRASDELLSGADERTRAKVSSRAARLVEGGLSYVLRRVGTKALPGVLEQRARRLPALPETEHALALRIAENMAHSRILAVRQTSEVLLNAWLPLHLIASVIAVVLLAGHVLTAALW